MLLVQDWSKFAKSKDLSSLVLVITILESLMGPGRNNNYAWVHMDQKRPKWMSKS